MSDIKYVVQYEAYRCISSVVLKENKIKHVFGLQGGAVVHIFDSEKKILE